MMEITLRLSDGKKKTFSEQELIAIVEKHLRNNESKITKIKQVPTEGKWFGVNPLAIDQNLFKEKREDFRQEKTRQYILEAFEEMKKNSKYARPFKTMFPKKTWKVKCVRELKELTTKMGYHNANWVVQALEWAQRIANGESWEHICNKEDTSNCFRLVIWKKGYGLVGGSHISSRYYPASNVIVSDYGGNNDLYATVPLVVIYE